jgi:ABC-2 type transport system ATP-binding protein
MPKTGGDDPAIEARGLIKVYGESRALDGIDLTIRRGQVFGFLGPNGAGKTTTIRILATLTRPSGGMVRVLGHDVMTEADAIRARWR